MALQGLQRIQHRFPDTEAVMVTATTGFWANRLVEADEEVGKLSNHLLNDAKLTIPIGIWMAKKVRSEDGGMIPSGPGPAFKDYPTISKPTIWLLDGSGIVRQVFIGYSRASEEQMANAVAFLRREQLSRSAVRSENTSPSSDRSTR